MTRLDSMLLPGESVVWRHDPEFSMGPKWPYLLGVGVLLVTLTAIGAVVMWNVAIPPRIAILAGLLLFMPVFFCAGPMLSGMWSRAVAVTAGRMVWRSGPGGLGVAANIDRSDIAAATIYEGSALLILHGQDGRTIRLSGIDETEPLARSLAVPTRVWRKGEDVQDVPQSLWLRIAGGFVTAGPLELLSHGFFSGDWVIFDEYGIVLSLLLVTLIGGTMLLHVVGEISTARKLSPGDRKKQACRRLNPPCRGKEPSRTTLATILAMPFIIFDRWLIHRAYGGPYNCDCPPETFGPGTVPSRGAHV